MKPVIIAAFSFCFVVTQAFTAEDIVRSNPPAQRVSAPPAKVSSARARQAAGVRNPAANAARPRPRLQPSANLRRNYPALAHPIQRGPLAMNTSRSPRNYQPRQTAELPEQGHKINVTGRKPHNPGNNPPRTNSNRNGYADALKRCRREHHDRNWWKRHCRTIVFVNSGYYYLNAGYWFPAYGYDPAYNYYDYDGPIYTYGDLLPDQVIANVQLALQEIGYYVGPITGSLGPGTRAALANFQRDYGLIITGAVDEPTVQSLGLI